MIKSKSVLAIIPARGGSKGIPGKNTKLLGNKPLIGWTIEVAKKSKLIDRIIVSTDSKEIASIAKKYGAEVPFIRPSKLGSDKASGIDVILHTLQWFGENDKKYDHFILLQPTSPFRKKHHIDSALELLKKTPDAQALVSVKKVDEHPYWMKMINKQGFLKNFLLDCEQYPNRQDLPIIYIANGAIYICKWYVFLKEKSFYEQNCIPYIMDTIASLDLDNMDDWNYAEHLKKYN